MIPNSYTDQAARIAEQANQLAASLRGVVTAPGVEHAAVQAEPFIGLFAVFLMACFVGSYVVWNVTPALHSPLMAVTNAISLVIIVGAMLATGVAFNNASMTFGFIAVLLASVNISGGFLVTQRMLSMIQARKRYRTRSVHASLTSLFCIIAAVLFILALRGLSNSTTSRRGNQYGIAGMAIAVLATLIQHGMIGRGVALVVLAVLLGGAIGAVVARRIVITALPQLVVAFHSLVGLAAVFVAASALNAPQTF